MKTLPKAKTPLQRMQLNQALRTLEDAQRCLEDAGENLASMKVGSILRGLV